MHLYLYKNPTTPAGGVSSNTLNSNSGLGSGIAPNSSGSPSSSATNSVDQVVNGGGGSAPEEKISIAHELGKIQFFKTIATYPNYIQLNLPSPTPLFSETSEDGKDLDFRDLSEVIITQHFLTGALIKEVISFNTKAELPSSIRSQV